MGDVDEDTATDSDGDYRFSKLIRLKIVRQGAREHRVCLQIRSRLIGFMRKYAVQKEVKADSLQFFFDGNRINDDDSPASLGMKDGDEIKVLPGEIKGAQVTANCNSKFVTIKLIDKDSEVHFRVKCVTALRKVKKAYAERVEAAVDTLQFLFDGRRVNDDDSPESLGMKDVDVIKVYPEGHNDAASKQATANCNADNLWTIRMKAVDVDKTEVGFRVKCGIAMRKLKKSYADRHGVPVDSLRFLFDGHRINDDDSPESLGMKDGDEITIYPLNGAASKQTTVNCKTGGKENSEFITMTIVDEDEKEIRFRMKFSAALRNLKEMYSERHGVPVDCLLFLFNGLRVNDDDTPRSLGMEQYDELEVYGMP